MAQFRNLDAMGSRASNFVRFDRVVGHIQGFEKMVATEDGFGTGVGIQVARASRRLLKHPPPMPRGLLSWSPTVDHRGRGPLATRTGDRKSTRLNSSHGYISYAVFCLKKKKKQTITHLFTKKNKH